MVALEPALEQPAGPIEVYWMPGCSSCLRMKEFVERTGLPYTAINVEEDREGATKLRDRGLRVPAICVGDSCVNGVHLESVAQLLGVEYTAPAMLPPEALADRYRAAMGGLRRLIAQITPEAGGTKLPHRDRDLYQVAGHAACVMRYFLGKYDDDDYGLFFDELEPGYRDNARLIDFTDETLVMFDAWWERDGRDDPLDAVMPVYWGHRTRHEALEREVWHTAQHTRQVALMLERAGVEPLGALTPQEVEGLPLPARVFD